MFTGGHLKKTAHGFITRTKLFFREAAIFGIHSYRVLLSPHFGNCCRFYPSCSVYAQQAIKERGLARGIFLTLKRLLKCQPLHPGGIDVIESGT